MVNPYQLEGQAVYRGEPRVKGLPGKVNSCYRAWRGERARNGGH